MILSLCRTKKEYNNLNSTKEDQQQIIYHESEKWNKQGNINIATFGAGCYWGT